LETDAHVNPEQVLLRGRRRRAAAGEGPVLHPGVQRNGGSVQAS